MESGRAGREARSGNASGTTHRLPGEQQVANVIAPKAKRKKARPATTTTLDPFRPIPQPYLALAPRPLSSTSSIAQTPAPRSNLVLPSSYRRPATAQGNTTTTNGGSDAGPSTRRERERERMFANGLLAPPTIRAGANTPSGRAVSPSGRRRRTQAQAVGMGAGNPSMTSLGQLGRIMETDPQAAGDDRNQTQTPAPRRRRRIVRADGEEGQGVSRRLTVSSREEGRAIGLARGASMRRLNVWDDVPQNDEPPPPFPFPTSSSSRLPPTFETTEPEPSPPHTTHPIPNSPPPTFEQATAQTQIPEISISTSTPRREPHSRSEEERPVSRASTRYESAPSSPILAAQVQTQAVDGEDERDDRKMWNADLLAGYSLEERVQREFARRESREIGTGAKLEGEGGSAGSASPLEMGEQDLERGTPASAAVPEAADEGTTRTEIPDPVSAAILVESIEPVTIQPRAKDQEPSPPVEVSEMEDAPEREPVSTSPPIALSTAISADPAAPIISNPPPTPVPMPSDTLPVEEQGSPKPTPRSAEQSVPDLIDAARADTETVPVKATEQSASASATEPNDAGSEAPVKETVDHDTTPTTLPTAQGVRSLSTLAEGKETDKSHQIDSKQASPKTILEQRPVHGQEEEERQQAPSRKLTRGKAIRRSSSGLIKSQTPTPSSPVVAAPLFSAARFDFGKSQAQTQTQSPDATSKPLPPDPPPHDVTTRPFIHRASAPEIPIVKTPIVNETIRAQRRSEDRGTGITLPGGRRLGDPPLNPTKGDQKGLKENADENGVEREDKVIPPHREAALLRRESILAKLSRPTQPFTSSSSYTASSSSTARPSQKPIPNRSIPIPPKIQKRASFPSGPLVDFSDYDPSAPPHNHNLPELTGLAASNAELLELLEQEASLPQSSSQAANTAQLVEDLRAQLGVVEEEPVQESKDGSRNRTPPPLPPRGPTPADPRADLQVAAKKKAPPPPPPLRSRGWTSGQKISIVDTATSPITPRPSIRRPNNTANPNVNVNASPSSPTNSHAHAYGQGQKVPPPLPTRRPPPPPPVSDDGTTERISPPPPPPLFRRTSTNRSGRPVSSISATTSNSGSSSYNQTTIAPLPLKPPVPPPWRGPIKMDRSPLKPRGPRPRPPPPPPRPRTWALVASGESGRERPTNERTHSEEVLSLASNSASPSDTGLRTGAARSNSEMDLTGRRRRQPEYTDLDVFVSRLEGSGREYEGFTHIAQFLGPAKSPAASSEAISTLLPGPITIESKRTTKEGKVKLKLSLLGVRVTKCPICITQFREGEMGVLLPVCGHLGHEDCARRWFREDDRCFVCRERLKVEEGIV